MSRIFSPDEVNWDLFLTNAQHGSGHEYFRGIPYQRGNGIGSVLKSVLKYLIPLGKQAGMAIAREGIDTVSRVMKNSSKGDLKEIVKNETKRGMKNLLNKAVDVIEPQSGSGKKSKPKKRIAYTKVPPKKRKTDALGFY